MRVSSVPLKIPLISITGISGEGWLIVAAHMVKRKTMFKQQEVYLPKASTEASPDYIPSVKCIPLGTLLMHLCCMSDPYFTPSSKRSYKTF